MRKLSALLVLAAASASQAALLHDNGPFQTNTGNGFNGANTSVIATGGTLFGSSINSGANQFSVADNFTVTAGEVWTLNSITFYTYQTQTNGVANNVSTITSARAAIYNAATLTNRTDGLVGGSLLSNGTILGNDFTGVYRVSTTALTNSQRAIMAVTVDLGGLQLTEGTYWAGWSAAGSVASGPWGVPVTPYTGVRDAVQWNETTLAWAALTDAGAATNIDLAFQLDGTSAPVPEPATMLALGGAIAAFARRRRK